MTKALKLLPSLELLPGFALDLSGVDEEGQSWDFTRAEKREKARALLLKAHRKSPVHVVLQLAEPQRCPAWLDDQRRPETSC